MEYLELYSSRGFGAHLNPFAWTGALAVATLTVIILTGALMLFWYVPSPDKALGSIMHLTGDVRLGSILRTTHRVSAELLIIVLLIHAFRNWATGRHRGPRARNWLIGLIALPLIGTIAWAGYALAWDDRAMVFVEWGKDILKAPDSWPIIGWFRIGTLLSFPLTSAATQSDLLSRLFAMHVGGAMLTILLLLWHLRRVASPRIRLPVVVSIVLVGFILFVAAMAPASGEGLKPYNLFAPPASVRVDAMTTFPLLFYPLLGGPILLAVFSLIWLGLALLPRLEPAKPVVACVRVMACVGCRLCMQDCPYSAIEMVPHPNPAKRVRGREIARVLPKNCNACGVCVGSCMFDAIELPALPSDEIVSRMKWVLETGEPPLGEYEIEGDLE
jgi:ferredoxin